jgi:hypothetical protein
MLHHHNTGAVNHNAAVTCATQLYTDAHLGGNTLIMLHNTLIKLQTQGDRECEGSVRCSKTTASSHKAAILLVEPTCLVSVPLSLRPTPRLRHTLQITRSTVGLNCAAQLAQGQHRFFNSSQRCTCLTLRVEPLRCTPPQDKPHAAFQLAHTLTQLHSQSAVHSTTTTKTRTLVLPCTS